MNFINSSSQIFPGREKITINYDPRYNITPKKANVHFNYKKHIYLTKGDNKSKATLWEVIPSSIKVEFFGPRIKSYRLTSLPGFFKIFPMFKKILDPTYNCHGYSIFDKQFYVNDKDADKIFRDEYEECEQKDSVIIVFKSKANNKIIHSAKYNVQTSTISDKQGIQIFNPVNTIINIQSVPEYSDTNVLFLRRKNGI